MDITEVAKILANRINQEHYILHYMEKVFKAGQLYQAKSMYSKEDMRKCWNAAYTDALSMDEETYKPLFFEDFIEQFKEPNNEQSETF